MNTKAYLLKSAALLATAVSSLGQPVITEQPTNQTVCIGESVTFAMTYRANGPLFQWRFNRSDLPNERSDTLQLSGVQFANAGDYSVVITDLVGSATSQVARLTVLPEEVVRVGDRELRFGQLSAPVWEAPRIEDESQSVTGDGLTLFYGSKAPGRLREFGHLDEHQNNTFFGLECSSQPRAYSQQLGYRHRPQAFAERPFST